MTTTENTTNLISSIAIDKLEKSPLNARRTVAKIGMEELKASILAHGLMQNLVVTGAADGAFLVIAGGRRLEAIRSLQAEGKLPADFAVPCQIVTEEHALEMSLAENTVRLAMHPADQFEAFAELIEQGHAAAQIAERFGIDERLVLKRMKLARVAPQLLQEYRDDGMTLECLMAYTITDDHKRQVKLYKSLQDWQKEDPSSIRDALTEKMIDASSKLARFVGLDAYMAAGGSSRADLFGDEVYLEKPALLNRLAEKKLDGIRKELEAEGWGWIEINPERDWNLVNRCSRIEPRLIGAPAELIDLKTQLDAEMERIDRMVDDTESDESLRRQQAVRGQIDQVEQQLVRFVGFDAGHKVLAGCFVSIGQDGAAFIDKGLVKPEHRKRLAHLLNADADHGRPIKIESKDHLPETLRRGLAADRLRIAQVEMAKHPEIAFDLLIFQAASEVLDEPSTADGPNVCFQRSAKSTSQKQAPAEHIALAEIKRSLPVDWLKPRTETARFEAFRTLPDAAKRELLAYCVALTLRPKLASAAGEEITAYDAAMSLTTANVADYWRPTKDNYLERLTRDQLLAISRDVLGEAWSQAHHKEKKSWLVDRLDRAFADPEKHGRAEQAAKLKSWLPAGMAFDIAAMVKPAKAKKTRKAA